MNYYPDIVNFNLDTPSGMALYCAHMDLDPIGGFIEYAQISHDSYLQALGEVMKDADINGEFIVSSKATDEMTIFSNRIVPLEYNAILVMMMSCLEEAFNAWCRFEEAFLRRRDIKIASLKEYTPKKKKSKGIDKACDYLQEYANITGIKQDPNWPYIEAIRTARNMIVHNGGRVKEIDRTKMKKYGIGMREEDFSVYIDYNSLKSMYSSIIEFIDRVFTN